MKDSSSNPRGIGCVDFFISMLQVLFIGLKIAKVISWKWVWVLCPSWSYLVIVIIIAILAVIAKETS